MGDSDLKQGVKGIKHQVENPQRQRNHHIFLSKDHVTFFSCGLSSKKSLKDKSDQEEKTTQITTPIIKDKHSTEDNNLKTGNFGMQEVLKDIEA